MLLQEAEGFSRRGRDGLLCHAGPLRVQAAEPNWVEQLDPERLVNERAY